jgi:hypothetical protein
MGGFKKHFLAKTITPLTARKIVIKLAIIPIIDSKLILFHI